MALDDPRRVLRLKQGREIEHGHVWLAVVVLGELESIELSIRGGIGGLLGIVAQGVKVDVLF